MTAGTNLTTIKNALTALTSGLTKMDLLSYGWNKKKAKNFY